MFHENVAQPPTGKVLTKGSASQGGVSRLQGPLIFQENAAITIHIDFDAHFVKFLSSKIDLRAHFERLLGSKHPFCELVRPAANV